MKVFGNRTIDIKFLVNNGKSIMSSLGVVLTREESLRYLVTDAVFRHWLFNTDTEIVGSSKVFPFERYLAEFDIEDAKVHIDFVEYSGCFHSLGKASSVLNAHCELLPLIRRGMSYAEAKKTIELLDVEVGTMDEIAIDKAEAIEIVGNKKLVKSIVSLYEILGLGIGVREVRVKL